MVAFSKRISMVKPSATLTINAKASELKSQGVEVISLAVGQPDLPPPKSVLDGAREAIDRVMTKYTPAAGLPEVLDAVCEYYNRFYDAGAKRENVIITNGGKQGLFNLMQILVDPGDEVLIPAPYWLSYPAMVILAGGVPKIVPTDPENNFMTSPSELEKHITEKTKILILNTPSNPTGCHYAQKQFDEICEFAIKKGIFIISDEIYDQLIYPPAEPTSASKWFKKYPDKVAIVNGLAKSFAVPGWRIGYVISDSTVIKNLSKLQGQSTSNVCSIAQMAALKGLLGDLSFLEENRKKFLERRNYILKRINSINGISCPEPMGAFYVFPKVDGLYTDEINNSTKLCEYLLDKAHVALVPGAAFGDDRCIRFSYAVDISVLERAMDQVEKALREL